MDDLTKLYRGLIADYLKRWAAWRYYNLTHNLRYKKASALHAFSNYHVANTHSTAEPPDIHDPISQKLQTLIIEYRKINPTKANLLVKHYMNHEHLAKNKIKLNGLPKTTYYRYLTDAHDWMIDHCFKKEQSVKNLLAYHQILDNN